jgi:RNA recognition motif-containing protein
LVEAAETMASEKRKKNESKKLKKNKKHKMEESAAEENDTFPGDVGENKSEENDPQEILNEKKEDETTEVKKIKKKEKKSKKKKKSKSAEVNDEESATKAQAEGTNANGANDGTNKTDSEKEAEPKAPSKSDEDSEDDELMAAAAAWAQQQQTGGDKDKADTNRDTTAAATPKSFSLHITQLPFDAIELDIRQHFAEKGCIITSIRLVYDKDERGRNALFRGVAFMDLLDQASYEIALKLNRSKVRGRKLNIRPTRSKQELANIVSQTQELVKAKILKHRDGQDDDADEKAKSKGKKKKAKKDEKKAKKKTAKAKNKTPRDRKEDGTQKNDPERKLTKKERNRRAAIIMSLRRK